MKTNAVRLLESLGVQYELREYQVDPDDLAAETVAAKIGMAAGAGVQNAAGAW
jgi:Cys-tRNA(Pro)/Cys-tRNA(Cys) deacylase